jgi:uncharacterized membrane protein
MKQHRFRNVLLALLGAALIMGGAILRKSTGETRLTSLAIAAGIFLFGKSTANLMKDYVLFTPKLKEQQKIEENDERNMQIREKAAWKSSSIMQYVLLIVGFALTFADDLPVGIIVLCLSMLQSFLLAGFTSYYQKRM